MNLIRSLMLCCFCGLVLLISCDDDSTTGSGDAVHPKIVSVTLKDKWDIKTAANSKIEVITADPQGPANMFSVRFSVTDQNEQTIFSDSLFDDGAFFNPNDGDVVAGDGIFSNVYSLETLNPLLAEGIFTISFIAEDKDRHISEPADSFIVFAKNAAPQILEISAPDTFPFYEPALIQATIADSNGLADISRVWMVSENTANGVIRFETELFDDGEPVDHGDQVAGDGVYSAILDSLFAIGKRGLFKLRFFVEDSFGETNDGISEQIIFVGNTVGAFNSIFVPQFMSIPSGVEINRELITASVQDPQGLADIDSVYFFSLKPDSNLANSGRPFVLVDNGLPFNINNAFVEAGDVMAGDGIYSFSLIVTASTEPGTYTFTFYMRDKAGNLTAPESKMITILSDAE